MDETAVRKVIHQLEALAESHNLESTMTDGDAKATLTDRDLYVAHEASAASFDTAIRLLRVAIEAEPDGYCGDDGR